MSLIRFKPPSFILQVFFRKKIIKIFHDRFKPINLYCFCHLYSHYYELFYNLKHINIQNKMLRLKKTWSIYKNFEKLFYEIWLNNFHTYILILLLLFVFSIINLNIALNTFYINILQLFYIYKWQKAIFLLIIKVYIYIILFQLFNSTN